VANTDDTAERLHRAGGVGAWFLGLGSFVIGLSVMVGCAGASNRGAPAPAPTPVLPVPAKAALPPGIGVEAELGGLDENEAERSFRASLDGLQECVIHGVERLEFMGGSIEFAVKIDANRQATSVWAAESSLGERSTEKCMFEALRAVTWPAPQGGMFGIARNSFEFEPKKGAPIPAVWDAGRVAGVVDGVQSSLDECGQGSLGPMLITLYIGDGGKALAGGAASEQPVDEDRVDCVVDALLGARYPQPERTPTKVRFRL
jgi:hypothetical protein